MVKKSISKTISGLILANKKLFSKNLSLPSLSDIEKIEIIILYISKVMSLIFWILILVFCILKPNWKVKVRLITLTLFSEFSKAYIWSLKIKKYQI